MQTEARFQTVPESVSVDLKRKLVTLPALMIFLSVALPPHLNRWANLWIAGVNIPYALLNLVGETWAHIYFAAAVEVALLCLILAYARTLPKGKA